MATQRTPKTVEESGSPTVETVAAPASTKDASTPTKPATKPTAQATKRPAAKAPAKAPAASTPAKGPKEPKLKKPKLVRDSFTIPKDEYAAVEALKQRTAVLGRPAKKSELLRAGLKLLASLSDAALTAALQNVPSIKTGRPKSEEPATAKGKTAKKAG